MNASPLHASRIGVARLAKWSGALLLLLAFAAGASSQIVRPFAQIFTTNTLGDVAIIGNTLHTSTNPAVRANAAATNLLVNNANWMARVDVDADTNTFNSSAASLSLPPGANILFAKLYWGAGTNRGNAAAEFAPTPSARGRALLSFNGGAYVAVTNTTFDMEAGGDRYQGSLLITDFVRTNRSGVYQVANVQSSTGSNTLAGWAIVVAYFDPAAPPRNIALYDGFGVVRSGSNATVNISLDGFTTPQFNAVVTRVGVVAYEGDSSLGGTVYTGDQMRLNGIMLPAVADPSTPTNDVFNSTISRLGTRIAAKNPDYTNQLGFDIKVLDATGVLTNTATNATITLTTGGETYYPGAVAFATELYAPVITIPKLVSDVNGGAINPGDTLLYTMSVTNSGGDWATNVVLVDPMPPNTTYVSNTFQITAGANLGPKTDAAGDDVVDFTNGVLVVRLGTGGTATQGGTISTNEFVAMTFMVRVNTNTPNGTGITNQATLSYSALVTGVAFASASTIASVEVEAGIFGHVFEDVNYAGGAGRNQVSSAGIGLPNARVELYNAANSFVGFTLTDATGEYVFSNVVAGAYSVRVVNGSVVSSRPGGATPGLLPVQTFRTDASSGTATDLVNLVGGENPGATDPGNGVFAGAQSVSPVLVTNNLYTGGVDFGFNFNTIVSTNNTGQGSARQFITNVNALAGLDRAVFMIPNGTASPGLNPAYDFTVSGVRRLSPSTPLPAITDSVLLDATVLPGYAGTPLVQLSGANAGAGANGLIFTSSGSTLRGVSIHSFSGSGIVLNGGTNNVIAGNVIGADPTGLTPLPNGIGILVATNATNNLIGGTTPGAANIIAFNTGAGVAVTGTTNVGNQIRQNSFYANGGLGIDLNNNGVTLNDLNDSDTGGNRLFNSPVITNAFVSGTNLVLHGYARPGSVIELFIAQPDVSGFGEGRTYLTTLTEGSGADLDATSGTYSGSINGVNQGTDNTARFSFSIPLPPSVSVGTVLTATATDAAGNTSEFGGNAPVGGLADLVVVKTGPTNTTSLAGLTYTISVTNLGPATAEEITVQDLLPPEATFVSASSGGLLSGNTVTWPQLASLASGASTSYTVTVTAPIGGALTNVAFGTAANVDPTPGNNNGSSTNARVITAVTPQADVGVSVTGPATVLAGANYAYTITITNQGPATATNVVVTNLLPAGVTFLSGTGLASVAGLTITLAPITLAPGEVFTSTLFVSAPASGQLTNRVSGTAATPDPDLTNNNGSSIASRAVTAVIPQADVSVVVSGPTNVLAGNPYNYTVSITNLGPSVATNVLATNALPAGVTYFGSTGGGSQSGGVVTWPGFTLSSGAGTNFTVVVIAPPAGPLTNTASGGSLTDDPNTANNNGSAAAAVVVTSVTPQADIGVTKTGPGSVLAAASFSYTLGVTNHGPSTATNVTVLDYLPTNLVFVSASSGGSLGSSNVVSWSIDSLAAGTVTNFTVTVTAPASGAFTNRASASSPTGDPNPTNNVGTNTGSQVTTTVTPQADVAVTVSGPANVLAGQSYNYVVTITNFGPSVATNAIATNALPAGVVFVSATSGGVLTNGAVIWPALTLPSGAGTNYTITVTAPPSGALINTASGGSRTADPDLSNNNGSAGAAIVNTTVTPQADVVVAKSGPATVLAGANFNYTISITNLGPSIASNVVASDALPISVTFVSATGAGTVDGGNVVIWPAVTLASGAWTNFVVTVTAPPSGAFTNTASATTPTDDPNPGNNTGTNSGAIVTTTVTPQADVAVGKSGPATVLAAQSILYTISVTNLGPSTASNVVASDELPAAVTFVSASGGGVLGGGNVVTWPATTLLAGQVTNFTVTVTAPTSGVLLNRASATTPTGDPNPTNNVGTNTGAQVTTSVTPQADVAVTVSGPTTVLAGATYTYTVSVTNFGPTVATNVLSTNALPAGVTFVSATGGGTHSGGAVTWPVVNLPSGAGTNYTITVTAPPAGVLTNRASGASVTPDPDLTNNDGSASGAVVTTTVTPQADVAVGKSGPATVLAAQSILYTISVTNLGPSTASNVVASDELPATVTFVSASGDGVLGGGNVVTWPATTLLAGQVTNFTVTVTAPTSGVLLNRASATTPTGDPNPTNNVGTNTGAQVTTSVTPQADVAVTVNGPTTVLAGASYTYTVSVTNFGPTVATNVLATNTLPAGVTFVSASGGGTEASGAVTWPVINLPSGAGTNYTITVTAPPVGVLSNRAAGSSQTPDPDLSNNDGSALGAIVTTTITPQADVAVGKSGPAGVSAGQNFTYTISVTNLGPSVASNVVVLDTLPASVLFVSASDAGVLGGGNVVTWPSVTLNAGAVLSYTVTVTAPASGMFTNFSSASSPTGDPNPTNNNGTATGSQVETTVGVLADVLVAVTGPGTVLAGQSYTYTVAVTNLGPSVATNVLATNLLPAGVVFVSSTGGGTHSGGSVTWPPVTLATGEATNFVITVTAPPSGPLTNRASGSSLTPDPDVLNNNGSASGAVVITAVTPQADVSVSKSGPATVLAGGNATYTISVTNHGPSAASDVVVSDLLPATATFVSASAGGVLGGGNVVTWPPVALASGATATFTVTVTAPGEGVLTNRASAASPTGDPTPGNNTGTNTPAVVTSSVIPQADVAVTASGPGTVLAGAQYTYTVTMTNFGPSVATNAIATNHLPAGVIFISATSGGILSGGDVTWPAVTLPPGVGTSYTATVSAPASGTLVSRSAGGSVTPDPDPANNNGSTAAAVVTTTVTPQADVAVQKFGPPGALAGSDITYTIVVTNFGPSTASNVVAGDILPAGVAFVSASGGGVLGGGNVVTWPAATLTAGAGASYTVTITAPAEGVITNVATATSPTDDPTPGNNTSTNGGGRVTTTITPQADVAVSKSGPALVVAGSNLTYTITLTNLGPSTASNVVALDQLPPSVTFVSASGGGLFDDVSTVTWPGMTLLAGAVTNFSVTVTAPPSGSFTNVASASSPTGDPNPGNNTGTNGGSQVTTTVSPLADVVVSKSGPATVLAGGNLTYTIGVTNLGPSVASNVVASDHLPAALTYVGSSDSGALGGGNVVTWPAVNLAAGAGVSFTVTATAPASGAFTNVASASSPTADPQPGNNTVTNGGSQITTTVIPQADVAVAKSGPATVLAGAGFSYSIFLTNFGPSTASNVVAVDTLPAALTFVSASDGGTVDGGNLVTWPAVTLTAGQVAALTVTVTAPASGAFTNVASASSPTEDPTPGNNTSTNGGSQVTTTVIPQADVAVGKTGPAQIQAGSNLTYTISVTNLGPSTASNVVAVDTLPANATFVSASAGGVLGGGNVVTWPAVTLIAGESTAFTVTVAAPATGSLVNVASASSPTGDPNPGNNTGTNGGSRVSTEITPQADLVVTVSGPTNALAGEDITYIISITNLGPSVATNAVATNTLPGGVTFVGTTGGGTVSNGVVAWPPLPTLGAGEGTNFTVTVTAPGSGVLTNAAGAGSLTPDPDLSNNNAAAPGGVTLTTITPQADVAVSKMGPSSTPAGSNYVYVVSVTNLGPSTASNVVVVDYLPASVVLVSASGDGALGEGGNVYWNVPALTVGEVTNFFLVVTAPASGEVTNRAAASSPTGDPTPDNNTGTNAGAVVVTTIVTGPQFAMLEAPALFNPQTGLFEQRVTVTNIGLSTAAAVRLYVTSLSTNATFHNPSGTNGGFPYAQYNSPLNPGQIVVFTLEFRVPNRRPFTNTLAVEAVLPVPSGTNSGAGVEISRMFVDSREVGNPRFVIEFPSTPGRVYTIIYSDDLVTWKTATPSVTAGASSTQWYDDGPPKTESKPLINGSRYYRVIVAP